MLLLCIALLQAAEPDPLLSRQSERSVGIESLQLEGGSQLGDADATAVLHLFTRPRWRVYEEQQSQAHTRIMETWGELEFGIGDTPNQDILSVSFALFGLTSGEYRRWSGHTEAPMFVGVRGAVMTRHNWRRFIDPVPQRSGSIRAEFSPGLGWGRILDEGPPTRLAKLERALLERGALTRALDPDEANEVLSAWFTERNHVSAMPALRRTEAILHGAGLLARPLDIEDGYLIRAAIDDARIAPRLQGMEFSSWIHTAFTHLFQQIDDYQGVDIEPTMTATWHHLLDADQGLTISASHTLAFGYQTLDGRSTQSHVSTEVSTSWFRAFYSPYTDPLGTLELTATTRWYRRSTNTGSFLRFAQGLVSGRPEVTQSVRLDWTHALRRGAQFRVGAAGALGVGNHVAVSGSLQAGMTWGVVRGRYTARR